MKQKIFAFGSNGSGQLGIGHTEDVSEPTRCLFIDHLPPDHGDTTGTGGKVNRIACGGNHTIILFEDGAAYAAGLNDDARCGVIHPQTLRATTTEKMLTRFERVRLRRKNGVVIDRFKDVCATWAASIFVATATARNPGEEEEEKEVVITLGSGDKGELGLGPGRRTTITATAESSTLPSREDNDIDIDIDTCIIPNFPPQNAHIISIASGMNHTVAILSNGDVYGWGASRKGQLGNRDLALIKEKIAWSPVKISLGLGEEFKFTALSVGCGREFSFIGGIKMNKSMGDGAKYMYTILGLDDKWNILSDAPSLETSNKFLLQESGDRYKVSTSWHGIYLHDTLENSVIAWGRNDRGQLGPVSPQHQQSMVRWTAVTQFVAGSEHAIALSSDNKTVFVCGWGEHGNCGPDTDEKGDVKERVSQIRLPDEILLDDRSSVVQLGAGCATSWIVASSS